jgi:hypothetical protein
VVWYYLVVWWMIRVFIPLLLLTTSIATNADENNTAASGTTDDPPKNLAVVDGGRAWAQAEVAGGAGSLLLWQHQSHRPLHDDEGTSRRRLKSKSKSKSKEYTCPRGTWGYYLGVVLFSLLAILATVVAIACIIGEFRSSGDKEEVAKNVAFSCICVALAGFSVYMVQDLISEIKLFNREGREEWTKREWVHEEEEYRCTTPHRFCWVMAYGNGEGPFKGLNGKVFKSSPGFEGSFEGSGFEGSGFEGSGFEGSGFEGSGSRTVAQENIAYANDPCSPDQCREINCPTPCAVRLSIRAACNRFGFQSVASRPLGNTWEQTNSNRRLQDANAGVVDDSDEDVGASAAKDNEIFLNYALPALCVITFVVMLSVMRTFVSHKMRRRARLTGKKPIGELNYIFAAADTNHDGHISASEYNALIERLHPAKHCICCGGSNAKYSLSSQEFEDALTVACGVPRDASQAQTEMTTSRGLNHVQLWDLIYDCDQLHVVQDARALRRQIKKDQPDVIPTSPLESCMQASEADLKDPLAPEPGVCKMVMLACLCLSASKRGRRGVRARIAARKQALISWRKAKGKMGAVVAFKSSGHKLQL